MTQKERLKRELARCRLEQMSAADLLRGGHPEQRGLWQCVEDWMMEEVILLGEIAREDQYGGCVPK